MARRRRTRTQDAEAAPGSEAPRRRALGREAENTIIRASFEEQRYERTQKAMALAKETLSEMHTTQVEATKDRPANFADPEWRRRLLIEIGLGAESLPELLRNYHLMQATIVGDRPRQESPREDDEFEDVEIPDNVDRIIERMDDGKTRTRMGG